MGQSYVLGLDLGQRQDYSALAVLRRENVPQTTYEVCHLERFELGTPYVGVPGRPGIAELVQQLVATPPLPGSILTLDATGVGLACVDVFRSMDIKATPIAVTITGGMKAGQDPNGIDWTVPKADLVAIVRVLLDCDRLKIAASLCLAGTLERELRQFSAKITPAGNETYASWRERDHDDVVLSVALAAWAAQRYPAFGRDSIGRGTRRATAGDPPGESLGRDSHRGPWWDRPT
jgi:hypothetical protein